MTKRKTNPKRPRRNARGQFTKARRRPEDYPTTSAPREQTPRNPIPPEDRWTWKVEPGGSGLKIGSVPGADEPAKPRAPLESAPYGPRRDASGAAPMTPLPASFDAETYGCGPANWEPPRAVVEGRYTMRSMFAVWRRWMRRRS